MNIAAIPLCSSTTRYVIRNAHIFRNGSWCFEDIAISSGTIVDPCDAMLEVDGKGLWITPALADCHTHLGIVRHSDRASIATLHKAPSLLSPDFLSFLDPQDPGFLVASRSNLATVCSDPGSTAVLSGNGYVLDCNPNGASIVRRTVLKCALGESVAHFYRQRGNSLSAQDLWHTLYDELNSLSLDAGTTVKVHAYTWPDLHAAYFICKDLQLDAIPLHAAEAITAIDRGAEFRRIIFGPINHFPLSTEASLLDPSTVSTLLRWGLEVALTTDAPVRHPRDLRSDAATLMRFRLSEEEALRTITETPRRFMKLPDGVSLGSPAHFSAFTKSPLDYLSTEVLRVQGTNFWHSSSFNQFAKRLQSFTQHLPTDLICYPERDLGGKSRGLLNARRRGYRVPNTLVLNASECERLRTSSIGFSDTTGHLLFPAIAVRSDASVEDSEESSYAGRFRTVLNVTAHLTLLNAIDSVWSSLRQDQRYDGNILIQEQIDAAFSGCTFFQRDQEHKVVALIEYVRGLGDGLVSGQRNPEERLLWSEGTGYTTERHSYSTVLDTGLNQLLVYGLWLLEDYPTGVDIEWAVTSDTTLHLLQVRPLTAPVKHGSSRTEARPNTSEVWYGIGVAPGIVSGVVAKNIEDVSPESILAIETVLPEHVYKLSSIGGLVTVRGGLTSHTGIVCRERGIPYLTGVTELSSLPEATEVVLNATAGYVCLNGMSVPQKRSDSLDSVRVQFVTSSHHRRYMFSYPWREIFRQARMYSSWSAFADHWPSSFFDPTKVEYAVADLLGQALQQTPISKGVLPACIANDEVLAYLLPLAALGLLRMGTANTSKEIISHWADAAREWHEPTRLSSSTFLDDTSVPPALELLAVLGELADFINLGRHCHSQHIFFHDIDKENFQIDISFDVGSSSVWLDPRSITIGTSSFHFMLIARKAALAAPLPYLCRKRFVFSFADKLPTVLCKMAAWKDDAFLSAEDCTVYKDMVLRELTGIIGNIQIMNIEDIETAYARILSRPLNAGTDFNLGPPGKAGSSDWPRILGIELITRAREFGMSDKTL